MRTIPARLAITAGEPGGIGPDLLIQLAQQDWPAQLVVFADPKLLESRAKQLNLGIKLQTYTPQTQPTIQHKGTLTIAPVPLTQPATAGILNTVNAPYVLETLRQACQGCLTGAFDALVTGPVHKGMINQAGIAFQGHTEFLAHLSQTPHVVMMLATDGLRVALMTTHIPLAEVPQAITPARLRTVIEVLYRDLQQKFALKHPRILVCGLNPHAGEDGYLGTQEQEVMIPTLEALRQAGYQHLSDPLPADTLFQEKYLSQADVVLAMYHDQGLPVLKYKGFGQSVNITLGLPFIRTSVDHGTALTLAGTGQANTGSFRSAITQALTILNRSSI